MKKYITKLRLFIKQYPLLLILILVGIAYMGLTWWIYRPITYRTPFYSNTKEYSDVSGAFNFNDTYKYVTDKTSATVFKKKYVLEEPYQISNYPVVVQVDGYELVEMSNEIMLSNEYNSKKGRYLLVSHITIKNEGDISYLFRSFSSTMNENSSSNKAVATDENFKGYNWQESNTSQGVVTINPHESHSGYMMFVIDENQYHSLFFEGSLKIMSPTMAHENGRARASFESRYSYLELPIAEEFYPLYMETLNAIPTSYVRRSNATSSVAKDHLIDQDFEMYDGRIKGHVNRVQLISETYRPLYLQNHKSYSRDNGYTLAFDITYTNISGSPLSIDTFQANIGRTSNEQKISTSNNDISGVVIAPGESFTVSYDNNYLPRDFKTFKNGEEIIISVQDGNRTILGTTTFILED
ncbi:MAG: hypothetical protein RR565_02350 [Erysipelothrix sp.]